MQVEQFALANGEWVVLSPGLLEVRVGDAGGAIVRSHALGAARGVRREALVTQVEVPGHGQVALVALSADDAVAIERALRTAILAAPDSGWDELFASPPAPAPASPPVSVPTSTPASAPAPAPASAPEVAAAPVPTPASTASAAAAAAPVSNAVVLASGYSVVVTAEQVLVRHHLGHAVSDLPRRDVLTASRSERTVTLNTRGGALNFIAASEQDAARLLALIETPGAPSASGAAGWSQQVAAPAAASAGAAGSWASTGSDTEAPTHGGSVAPLRVTLPSGFQLLVSSALIEVRNPGGEVVSNLPMATVHAVMRHGAAVNVLTTTTEMTFNTASDADAQRLEQTVNTFRQAYPTPNFGSTPLDGDWSQPTAGRPSSQGIPTWAIVVAVIFGLMFLSNLFN